MGTGGTVTATTVTDGFFSTTSGAVTGVTTLAASDDVTLSKNTAAITHSGTTSLTVSSTSGTVAIESVTFTGGAITGVGALLAAGTIQGGTVSDGTFSTTSGAVTGVTTLAASDDVTLSKAAASITHSGTTSLTVTSTGTVIVESVTFTGDVISGVSAITVDSVTVGAGNAAISSDQRLKENITVITNASAIVDALVGVRFDWKPTAPGSDQ